MEGTSVCLLTCNRPGKLSLCAKLALSICVEPYELIIVDNGSVDKAVEDVLKELETDPHVKVIRNEENLGLSRGVNQGFDAAQYPYLVHIEDDIIFQVGEWNRIMVDYFERYSEIGTIAPNSGYTRYIQRAGYNEVDWHLGMVWGIRREVLNRIGPAYDERLFHQNECDLCLRVRMAGYRCTFLEEFPPAHIVHDDDGGIPSKISQLRLELGTMLFRDKWAKYFLGEGFDGCFTPLYMWEDYPLNQEFMREYSLSLELNKDPEKIMAGRTQWDVIRRLKSVGSYGEPDWRRAEYLRRKVALLREWYEVTGEWLGDIQWWGN